MQVAEVVPGGEKNTWWGLVFMVGAIEAMIGPAICGYLSDRCGSRFGRRKPFIAIGAALTAIALLFLGQATTLWMMIVGYLFLQISDDIGTGPYSALVPDLVPAEHRGSASGVMSFLQLFAQITAAVTGLALGSVSLIYLAIAIINIICALIVLTTIRDVSRPPANPIDPKTTRESNPLAGLSTSAKSGLRLWLDPWRSPDFRWVWFTRFLNALGFYLVTLFMINYLTDTIKVFDLFVFSIGEPKNATIVLALIMSLMGALSSLYSGRLADRIGRKRVITRAGWIMFATLVPFALIPIYWIILALAVVFGIGYGMYLSASWALVADVLPNPENTAKDMGIWQMSVALPQVFTGMAGRLVDFGNGIHMGYGYSLAFLVSSIAFLFGCLLVNRVKGST
jgi:MFS family permease